MQTKAIISLAFVFVSNAFSAEAPKAADFIVATNGSDQNPGTEQKPFLTLTQARDAVRSLIAQGLSHNVTVWIRGGTYELREPLVLTERDSGSDQYSITYAAYPGESPRISGGIRITNWAAAPNGNWTAKASAAGKEGWKFRELFVNGQRRVRARHPNSNYFHVVETGPDRRTSFSFNSGEIENYKDLANVELVFLHDWSVSRVPLKAVNEANHTLTVAPIGAAADAFTINNFEKHPRYFLENSIHFLDAPGEWYLDNEQGLLAYRPMPGETMSTVDAVAPIAKALLIVRGDAASKHRVKNVHFTGLNFEHCAWPIPKDGFAEEQAGFHEQRNATDDGPHESVPAALIFESVESSGLQRCQIAHVGGSGLRFGRDCKNNSFTDSVITDISGNGLMIGEGQTRTVQGRPWWQVSPEEATQGTTVTNNLIESCGQQFFGCVGVWIGLAKQTTVSHNEIRNLTYTGISVGWMWNPTPTPCGQNVIEFNHIYHVMQTLSDGGGIYTLGLQHGTILRGNVIHDVPVNLGRAESNGMFLDEGTTDIVIEDNTIYSIARSPLRFHQAGINTVHRNLLVIGKDIPTIRFNSTKEENIRQLENTIASEMDLSKDTIKESIKTALGRAGRTRSVR